MTPLALHHALRAEVSTAPRFVLVVMALHADHKARCSLSLREIGDLTGLSPQGVSDALKRLQEAGFATLTQKGAGPRASTYTVAAPTDVTTPPVLDLRTPAETASSSSAPEPVAPVTLDPLPAQAHEAPPESLDLTALSSRHVRAVIEAARVDTSNVGALYWSRHEHVADLRSIGERTGLTLTAICERLRAAPAAGPIRRLTALEERLA